MNLIEEYKKGQSGKNKGLPMGDGLNNVSKAINGVQKGRIYGIAASSKTGKSTFADYAFVIQPFLHAIENKIAIEWIYFSFELDRVSKEFDFASFFLYNDYNIEKIKLDDNITYTNNGIKTNIIDLSPDYLRGRLQDDNGNIIKVKEQVENKLKEVYSNRIIPLFGEFSKEGIQLKNGLIQFIEEKDNPTGLRNFLLNHASKSGTFIKSSSDFNNRITGYKSNNPNKYTIIITDHLRKLIPERGFQMKQNVDKFIEYSVELRNTCGYTFVHIIHTNRNMYDIEKIKYNKNELYPTSESIKDTGNLSEDADYVFTMFNPNDNKFKIDNHFNLKIKDRNGDLLYPNMRTLHLVESRHCIFPQHFRTNMIGNLKSFKKLEIK